MAVELCVSEKKWGPIHAALYVTDENTIIVKGTFHDEDRDKIYPGPEYVVAEVSKELVGIKAEHPHRYLRACKWRSFLNDVWQMVEDNPWFRYDI